MGRAKQRGCVRGGPNWRPAFVTWQTLVTVLCIGGFCFARAELLSFSRSEAPRKRFCRTLTFEERVNYQRLIEEVYWQHRIWPDKCSATKPRLDAVMSRIQLEEKVEDYLRNSQALEDYWHSPVTADQLQAELNRLVTQTRQPDVLRELFHVLDDDPFVVAECLARPVLTERAVKDRYAYDERIHGKLRQRAAADLLAHSKVEQMKQTSGRYAEIELVRSGDTGTQLSDGTESRVEVDLEEWNQAIRKLAATFGLPNGQDKAVAAVYDSVPVGELSPLQENEAGYYATAVTEKAEGRLKIVTVTWSKEPLQSWRAEAEKKVSPAMATPDPGYNLPAISAEPSGCADTWAATAINLPSPRDSHSAVWTGSEMIVWGGGVGSPFTAVNTGGRYDPVTNAWRTTSTVNAPSPRGGHTAIWTGTEMIIWGGGFLNTGGRYNPATDTWTPTSTLNAPEGRTAHSGVWTGTEMIVWGGSGSNANLNTGGRYNPITDTWRATSMVNAPDPRIWQSTVWTGTEMIVWGGYIYNFINKTLNTGGRYNPATDTWSSTSTTNAPVARLGATAVWTGTQMIVWGGTSSGDPFNIGPFSTRC